MRSRDCFVALLLAMTGERAFYEFINLDFIKSAVQATGDPDIKSFLEPKGWILYKKPELGEISSNFEKEVNDVYMAVSNLW